MVLASIWLSFHVVVLSIYLSLTSRKTWIKILYLHPRGGEPSCSMFVYILLPHHSHNTIPPDVWFVYPNISPLCFVVVILDLSTNWLISFPIHIPIPIPLLLRFVVMSKIMNGSKCDWNTCLDVQAVFRSKMQNMELLLQNTKYSLNHIVCWGMMEIEQFFLCAWPEDIN